jgi:hypothetical protein
LAPANTQKKAPVAIDQACKVDGSPQITCW